MTAALLACEVESTRIAWNTTLGEFFPKLAPIMHPAWRGVTIAQVLCQIAGVPADLTDVPELWPVYGCRTRPVIETRRKVVAGLLERAPHSKPGERFFYSNLNYVIAGAALEALNEQPWGTQLQAQLFEPLGMLDSGVGRPGSPLIDRVRKTDRATTQRVEPSGHFSNGKPSRSFDNVPLLSPAGSVHCSLDDWVSYARFHLRGARGEKELMLQPSTFASLHTGPQSTQHMRDSRPTAYGGGWFITTHPAARGTVLMHDGSNSVWYAVMWILPEDDLAIVVSCNQGSQRGREAVMESAERLIHTATGR